MAPPGTSVMLCPPSSPSARGSRTRSALQGTTVPSKFPRPAAAALVGGVRFAGTSDINQHNAIHSILPRLLQSFGISR